MGMEAVPQQFAQDAPHAGQAQPTGGDVLPGFACPVSEFFHGIAP